MPKCRVNMTRFGLSDLSVLGIDQYKHLYLENMSLWLPSQEIIMYIIFSL